uniref:Ribosomal protein S14 n=1 Tax=Lophophytum leandri TaxID=1618140 RepID=A0A8E7IVG9_9MAGN|nr:ribosomal protein S14 [Lophophytum leandri]
MSRKILIKKIKLKKKYINIFFKKEINKLFLFNDKFKIKVKLQYIYININKFCFYTGSLKINYRNFYLSRQKFIKMFYECLFSGIIIYK